MTENYPLEHPRAWDVPWREPHVRGPYIRMHSGRKMHLLDPEWYLPDIAYHAAGVHRYTGGSRFTIGQHMVVGAWMAERFYPTAKQLPAKYVGHDAPESVYGDMSSPLKRLCPEYCALLAKGEDSFQRWTGVRWDDDPLVKEVDLRMWLTERLVVFEHAAESGVDMTEDYAGTLEPFPLTVDEMFRLFRPWHSAVVESTYLKEFRRLLPHMEGK